MLICGNKVIDISSEVKEEKENLEKSSDAYRYHDQVVHGLCNFDGKIYYSKWVSENELINELIGSALSKKLGLDAVDYKIGIDSYGNLYALSEVFYEDGFAYSNPYQMCDIFILDLLRIRKNYVNERISLLNDDMKEAILKLTALDIKMCQMDRRSQNIMIKKDLETNERFFAPMFDFGFSYSASDLYPESLFYDNPYLIIRKNVPSLKLLARKHPQFYDYARNMARVNMNDLLDQIEKENDIKLSTDVREYYVSEDENYNRVLKKV